MSICSWILHVVEIRWHLELVWLSKMAYSLDCLLADADFSWELTQTTDQVVYTCFLHITWTSHSMTIIFQELVFQQSEPTTRSCQTGTASLPHILLGSFPGSRIGGGDLAWTFLDSCLEFLFGTLWASWILMFVSFPRLGKFSAITFWNKLLSLCLSFLLKEIEGEVAQSCPALCNPMDCSLLGPIHGILKARILDWVAISFSRGSSRHRDRTRVSPTADKLYCLSHQGLPFSSGTPIIQILLHLMSHRSLKLSSFFKNTFWGRGWSCTHCYI